MGDKDGYTHAHILQERDGVSLSLEISFVGFGAWCLLKGVRRYRHTEWEYNYPRERYRSNSNLP